MKNNMHHNIFIYVFNIRLYMHINAYSSIHCVEVVVYKARKILAITLFAQVFDCINSTCEFMN